MVKQVGQLKRMDFEKNIIWGDERRLERRKWRWRGIYFPVTFVFYANTDDGNKEIIRVHFDPIEIDGLPEFGLATERSEKSFILIICGYCMTLFLEKYKIISKFFAVVWKSIRSHPVKTTLVCFAVMIVMAEITTQTPRATSDTRQHGVSKPKGIKDKYDLALPDVLKGGWLTLPWGPLKSASLYVAVKDDGSRRDGLANIF